MPEEFASRDNEQVSWKESFDITPQTDKRVNFTNFLLITSMREPVFSTSIIVLLVAHTKLIF